jgi:hypothetical protein
MANTLAPFGFTPVRRLDGATWTGNQSHRLIAAANVTPLFQGDVVVSLNTGYISRAAPGTTQIAGIFVGCEYYSTAVGRKVFSNYWPGVAVANDVDAFIIDDPLCVFLVQTWSATTNKATLASINGNYNFNNHTNNSAVPDGNTSSGISGNVLDADTSPITTATLPFRVVGVPGLDIPNLGSVVNGYDTSTIYNVALVAFNNQDFKSLTGI